MKTLLKILLPLILVITLIIFIFNVQDYDLYTQFVKATSIEFPNFLDSFDKIVSIFEGFDTLPSGFSWDAIAQVFKAIWELVLLPFRVVAVLIENIVSILKFVLTILGLA